ncbi:MAG: response regulator [Limisphaerales bacterium]
MMRSCVLQIDDDENDIYLLKFAWEQANVKPPLVAVTSGMEALRYFERQGQFSDAERYPFPSLVLLDLRMPRMNGLEVLEWMRAQPKLWGLVVVVLTASAYPDDVEQACKLGANAFVQKPGSHEELVALVQALKAFWFQFHEFPARADHVLEGVSRPRLQP